MFSFSFGKTEEVYPLSYEEGLLVFSCAQKYRIGKTVKVRLNLAHDSSGAGPKVSVIVVQVEDASEGAYLCTAALREEPERMAQLMLQFAAAGLDGACRRDSRRIVSTLRILSRELPQFRAVTVDVSLSGARLRCDGPVQPGNYVNLKFDLSMVGYPELEVQAQCMWCRAEKEEGRIRTYLVGVRLTQQHAQTHAAWAKFYGHLLGKEGASVMLKSMEPDEARTRAPAVEAASLPASAVYQAPPPPAGSYGGAPPSFLNPSRSAPATSPLKLQLPAAPLAASNPFATTPPLNASASFGAPPPVASAPLAMGFSFAPLGAPAPSSTASTQLSWGAFQTPQATFVPPRQVPERVDPLGIEGSQLAFRGRYDSSYVVGQRKAIELAFVIGGQPTVLEVSVHVQRVEPVPDGSCVCWCTVMEEAQKVEILNQLLD